MASAVRDGRTVIVVGSGLAGLTAASAALQSNANAVVLLERAAKPGGNSIKASSGINGAPTRFQLQSHPDTAFFSDTVKSAGKRIYSEATLEQTRRKGLIKLLTDSSAAAVDFLANEIGVDLSVVTQLGGHSAARTHRGAGRTPPGADIITRLLGELRQDSRFELKTDSEVIRLLSSSHSPGPAGSSSPPAIIGVEYRSGNELSSVAGPVVFATGGFAGDADGLLAKHRPDLSGLPSTNEPRSGMHRLLTDVGAQLVDMDSVQIHPTGFVDPLSRDSPLKFLAAEMLRGEGGILLHNGRRFVDELDTREHVSRAIMDMEPGSGPLKQWDVQLLLDPGACQTAASHVAFYEWKGLLSRKKVSELDETTRSTLRDYSLAATKQIPDVFGRTSFGHWALTGGHEDDDQEVCIGWVTPVTHFTMGGVAINDKCQVLSSSLDAETEAPVPGLWAAGEITGGIHGDNRLGGSSLLECVVFGRIAGEQAAAEARSN
ncbi:hypothetical protein SEUCBS139899_010864 [Sporothrix eucalyptigena]|uniref:Fumarate reductase n=1 Tax=Sporothrix eucalyptigena TaxID=1812306 RepID=A0ABP0BI64_9PEZI